MFSASERRPSVSMIVSANESSPATSWLRVIALEKMPVAMNISPLIATNR